MRVIVDDGLIAVLKGFQGKEKPPLGAEVWGREGMKTLYQSRKTAGASLGSQTPAATEPEQTLIRGSVHASE